MQELMAIERKVFPDPVKRYVKDLFLYSCYTGLAFVDVLALKEADFEFEGNGTIWCKIYRTKSDDLCAIPLLKTATAIFSKYREDAKATGRQTIFQKISNQHVNDNLKIMQSACEIATYLTFHIARHTFAKTVALKNGYPWKLFK